MALENTVASFDRRRVRAGGLHLASANLKVTSMNALSTTNLRVVVRNPALTMQTSSLAAKKKVMFAERPYRSRKAFVRMAIAAAAAPMLWLVHALAQHLHRAF